MPNTPWPRCAKLEAALSTSAGSTGARKRRSQIESPARVNVRSLLSAGTRGDGRRVLEKGCDCKGRVLFVKFGAYVLGELPDLLEGYDIWIAVKARRTTTDEDAHVSGR